MLDVVSKFRTCRPVPKMCWRCDFLHSAKPLAAVMPKLEVFLEVGFVAGAVFVELDLRVEDRV